MKFRGQSNLANRQFAITPSDDDPVGDSAGNVFAPCAIFVTVTGDVVVEDVYGNEITYPSWPAGEVIPCMAQKVKAATAATVIGLK